MKNFSIQAGYWAAAICALSFIIWIICFTGIAVSSPLFFWTNLEDYIQFYNSNNQFFQVFAKSTIILFAISFLILINSLYEIAPDNKKAPLRLSLLFAALFIATSGTHYFLQISSVRFSLDAVSTDGLQHFLQANPQSISSALNMFGWCIFYSLSSLFATGMFEGKKLIQASLIANGVSGLLAGFGYLFQIDLITGIFINIGIGGATLIFSIGLFNYFRKLR